MITIKPYAYVAEIPLARGTGGIHATLDDQSMMWVVSLEMKIEDIPAASEIRSVLREAVADLLAQLGEPPQGAEP